MKQWKKPFNHPLLTPSDFNFDMQHENIMFPCVKRMDQWLADPLDTYYMYFAAHSGIGIGLATASDPLGPWRMYEHNPVFTLEAVSPPFTGHVSSPELYYHKESKQFLLYFHGPCTVPERSGQMIGLATSSDGLSFQPVEHNPILTTESQGNWDSSMTAYLRIIPDSDPILGLYMGHDGAKPQRHVVWGSKQGLAHSQDGFHWQKAPGNPILQVGEGEWGGVRHTALYREGDQLWVAYSPRITEDLTLEAINLAQFRISSDDENKTASTDWVPSLHLEEYLGTILKPDQPWEKQELRDPFFLPTEDGLFLYYVGGEEQGIGVAKRIEQD